MFNWLRVLLKRKEEDDLLFERQDEHTVCLSSSKHPERKTIIRLMPRELFFDDLEANEQHIPLADFLRGREKPEQEKQVHIKAEDYRQMLDPEHVHAPSQLVRILEFCLNDAKRFLRLSQM